MSSEGQGDNGLQRFWDLSFSLSLETGEKRKRNKTNIDPQKPSECVGFDEKTVRNCGQWEFSAWQQAQPKIWLLVLCPSLRFWEINNVSPCVTVFRSKIGSISQSTNYAMVYTGKECICSFQFMHSMVGLSRTHISSNKFSWHAWWRDQYARPMCLVGVEDWQCWYSWHKRAKVVRNVQTWACSASDFAVAS